MKTPQQGSQKDPRSPKKTPTFHVEMLFLDRRNLISTSFQNRHVYDAGRTDEIPSLLAIIFGGKVDDNSLEKKQ